MFHEADDFMDYQPNSQMAASQESSSWGPHECMPAINRSAPKLMQMQNQNVDWSYSEYSN